MQITVTKAWNFNIARNNDKFLMDIFRRSGSFSATDLKHLNAVRLYLRVATLSDITTADGTSIDCRAFLGQPLLTRTSPFSWPRQPVITTHQQGLWTRALRHHLTKNPYSQDNDSYARGLTTKLTHWTSYPNQRYQQYYDPLQNRLLIVVSSATSESHQPAVKSRSRHYQYFELDFTLVNIDVFTQPYLIPADRNREEENGDLAVSFYRSSFRTRDNMPTPETVKAYSASLPPARQRLLAWSQPSAGYSLSQVASLLQNAVDTQQDFAIASDGGLSGTIGTFGVVLATGSEVIWEGAGPADGDPTTANSKRPELTGYAASLEMLLMLKTLTLTFDLPPHFVPITTWIDSSAAGKHLTKLLSGKSYKRNYPHDSDLLSHICWL